MVGRRNYVAYEPDCYYGGEKAAAAICALTLALPLVTAALAQSATAHGSDRFKDVKYLKTADKKKAEEVEGELEINKQTSEIRFQAKGAELVKLEKTQVTNLSYERASRPRYISAMLIAWPLIFTKGKKHFLTIQYKNAAGQGEFALFHLDKGNYQRILASAEATTGVKVERLID